MERVRVGSPPVAGVWIPDTHDDGIRRERTPSVTLFAFTQFKPPAAVVDAQFIRRRDMPTLFTVYVFTDEPSFTWRSEEHTSELQSRENLVCRLLLEKRKNCTTR